jgi:hypothetical protein
MTAARPAPISAKIALPALHHALLANRISIYQIQQWEHAGQLVHPLHIDNKIE